MALTAITRELNAAIGTCELTFLPRAGIDVDLALQQHRDYEEALTTLGCHIVRLSTETGLADSVFIEDTAVILEEIAVMCRPGVASRRAEVAKVERTLRKFCELRWIESPGTLDGGDVLVAGKAIFAGLSTRSNESGIGQLRKIVADYGYSVTPVVTTHCLHLKSAVSIIAPGMLLINPDWIDGSVFEDYERVTVDRDEAHAANALRIDQELIYPSAFPRTRDKLIVNGFDVTEVDVSELQKAEGAVTCCSLILDAQARAPGPLRLKTAGRHRPAGTDRQRPSIGTRE
jgi:dimethylargininase